MTRRKLVWLFLFLIPVAAAATAATQDSNYKVETAGPCANPEVDAAIKDSLQAEGVRVTGPDGVLCDVWLRKLLPQKGPGADYRTLINGTFTGVISFTAKGGDYRGQSIKPGTYVMRYQTIPKDGNHMGASPTPHFVVLTPVAEDKDPAAVLDYKALMQLSRKASGTNHPVNLYLGAPASGGKPGFISVGEEVWAVESSTKAQPAGGAEADFPVAIVLIGKCEG